jgi:hypothetical protein
MECCLKDVEETSSEDGIIGVDHVHHIKSYKLCASIGQTAKRHGQRYRAYWFNFSSTETV